MFYYTTYNEWSNNQWSDEVINDNDINFIQQSVGTYTQNSRYNEYYDTSGDGIIDDIDIGYLSSWLGYYYDGISIKSPDNSLTLDDAYMNIFRIDYNGNNTIDQDEIDYFLGLYPLGTVEYKGNNSLQYMDIDGDGYISQDDANYLISYANKNKGLNPYNDYISNIILTGDTYHNGAMYLENTNLDLNGYKLVINGNFVFRTANPYNSMWNDNPAVTLNINGGTLYIKEQFDFGQANSYDKIIMDKENGELYIFGNWNYITLADMEGLWTDGTIYFCGANWQVNEASGEKSVYSTEKHSIWFYYEYGQQVIRWDNTKDYTFDPITGKKTTPRALNFNYTDSSTGTCLGVFFPYGYTDDRYYFRPSLPDYITNYKDEDGNGIDDNIEYLISTGGIDVPKDWIINNIGTDENGQDISNLVNPENPNSDDNTSALAKWLGDVKKGVEGVKETYDTVRNTLIKLSNSIPDEVKLAYDGFRFVVSISPDPICQTIDFVLSIGDVAYDLLTFECTTAWFADLGLDLIGVIPYVGAIKEFVKNTDNAVAVAKLSKIDGLLGWITQEGIIKTVDKVGTKALPETISLTFKKTLNDILPQAEKLLENKNLHSKIDELIEFSDDIPFSKYIDRRVDAIKVFTDNGEDAFNTLYKFATNKEVTNKALDIINDIKDKNIDNFIDILDKKKYRWS